MSKLKITTDVPNEIHMTRTFDAPRRLVIRAMTEPALLKRWLGNTRGELLSAEVDLQVGGTYRYAFRATNGFEFAFRGTYDEIAEDRIVQTEVMEGMPGEAKLTTTFVEQAGKTTMTIIMRLASQEMRDAIIATGMEHGAAESYDNLEALVKSL